MRWALVVMLVMGTGCSWIWQDRLSGGMEAYSPVAEPRCSTSRGWAAIDGALAGSHLVSLGLIATREVEQRNLIIGAHIFWVVIHGASAISGARWSSTCREAYGEWNAVGPELTAGQRARRAGLEAAGNHRNDPQEASAFWCNGSECVVDEATCGGGCTRREAAWCTAGRDGFVCKTTRDSCQAARFSRRDQNMGDCVERRPGRRTEEAPRGFYCASSVEKAVGICTRMKADCQREREASGVTDLGECRIVEAAFCQVGGEVCAPTREACEGRTQAACEERK